MSVRVLSMVWDNYPGGGSELLALLALADWSDDEGHCFPSIQKIAEKVRLKERQAQRVVHSLIAGGFVQVTGNELGGPPGASRRYRLNLSRLTGVTHDTPTGVSDDTRQSRTGVMEDGDGCHPRRETGVTHDTLTVSEPSVNHQEVGGMPPVARKVAATGTGRKSSAATGVRLPAEWALPKAWGEWAMQEVPEWTPDHVRKVGERFGDYWRAKSGKDATKADWLATWRNWVRREAERMPAPTPKPANGATDPFRGCI